jgi:hypothetical protein
MIEPTWKSDDGPDGGTEGLRHPIVCEVTWTLGQVYNMRIRLWQK